MKPGTDFDIPTRKDSSCDIVRATRVWQCVRTCCRGARGAEHSRATGKEKAKRDRDSLKNCLGLI